MSKRILLLGVYGMELVECGGALAKNIQDGGESFASIMLAGPSMRESVQKAAEILGVKKLYFNDFKMGEINFDRAHKTTLIRVIREVKPEIVITQDPDRIMSDLDPDRRPAMTLILEAIALAGRDFAMEDMPELEPHSVSKIYYMSPINPNCTINIASAWDLKEKGMDILESQMTFSGKYYERKFSEAELEILAPGFKNFEDYYTKGRTVQRAIDKSMHMYYGAGGHGRFALAEAYRYEGRFEFDGLW